MTRISSRSLQNRFRFWDSTRCLSKRRRARLNSPAVPSSLGEIRAAYSRWRQRHGLANVTRLAMWSGPRNISTAMMRAWGNRTDTVVIDEPFYAFYLKVAGKNHPGAADIIANSQTDWKKIVYQLTTSHPTGKA